MPACCTGSLWRVSLDSENRILRTQLNYVPDPDPSFVTARVIGDTGGAFVHSMLINAGSRDGIRKGQAVTAGENLVGANRRIGGAFIADVSC